MAKITPGPLAGVVSGKIGNTVFSRGKYGPYIRNRMMPTAVQSAATLDVRGRLTSLSKAWATLTAGEKQAWVTWAQTHPVTDRLGASNVLQGSACYTQINARILQAGGTAVKVPPITASPAPVAGLSITAVATAQAVTVAYTSTTIGANECMAAWVSVCDSAGRSYVKNLLKLVEVSPAAQATAWVITTNAVLRFGKLIIGQKYHLEVEVWDKVTGLKSGIAAADFTVIAA